MKIKKLELIGFKSFKDRTVVQFDDGITGIVGPNGCGKSNIVDALVWVMGEMSAKHLRGSSMSDVIFAGAEGFAPMGMAEVSLTLENDGGPFPALYQRFSEIQITRRLHRNGESEYLINREPARLRDIQEIFMDTGAGAKGFSIIEQGAIGKIITSKPEDRKMLVEEAAGITKFKVRKRESQRKLEATEQNLVRLRDILGEQRRQLDSLERQAQKAERYRKIKHDIESKDLLVSSRQYKRIREELATLEAALADLKGNETRFELEFRERELELQTGRLRLAEIEVDLSDKRQTSAQLLQSIRKAENEVRELRFELEQARRDQEKSGTAGEQLRAREQALSAEWATVTSSLNSISGETETARRLFVDEERSFNETQALIQRLDEELTQDRKHLLANQQSQNQMEAKRSAMGDQLVILEERLENDREVFAEIKNKQKEFSDRKAKVFQELEQSRQMSLEFMHQVELFAENLQTLERDKLQRSKEVEEFKDQLNQVSSRLYGLEALRDNYEGFEAGVKNVMVWQKSQAQLRPDGSVEFHPLAEVIDIPTDYERALEASMGQRLQVLVGGGVEDSLSAIEYLREQKSGRSSFLMGFDGITPSGDSGSLRAESGVLALMPEVAEISSDYRDTLSLVLRDVVIVDSLRTALRLKSTYPTKFFVTPDGDTLSADGVLTGGASEGVDSGVLRRKREIRELQQAKDEWSGKLALGQLTLQKIEARVETVGQDLEKAEKLKMEQELKVTELRKDYERAENELRTADQAVQRQSQELARAEAQVLQMQSQVREIDNHLAELYPRIAQLTESTESKLAELNQSKAGIGERQARVMDLRARLATLEQSLTSAEQTKERVYSQLTEVRSELEKLQFESERTSQSLSTNSVLIEQRQVDLERRISEQEQLEKALGSLQNDFELLSSDMRAKETLVSQLNHDLNQAKMGLHQSELRREQLFTNERVAVEQIRERYQIDLAARFAEFAAQDGDEVLVAAELEDLRKKLASVGDVNLAAIDEYTDLQKRSEFMTTQLSELEEAKSQLQKVIERINRICVKRFRDTFDQINERFQKVFPVLFGGGEARLILIEDAETQEQGIDIIAKPPGKKMQNVTLLSGGEKALTAVALIFSIFLVKPSPFCLLDEVDAPLDDANVVRFNDLVREMAKRSQIIVVTHNKHTMRINNKLYGVTMEDKGVSKMVSVQLDS